MNKEKTIKNMTKFFAEIYNMSIQSVAMDDELIIELDDCCELECVIDIDLDSWIRELRRVDFLNQKVVEIAKEKSRSQSKDCRSRSSSRSSKKSNDDFSVLLFEILGLLKPSFRTCPINKPCLLFFNNQNKSNQIE